MRSLSARASDHVNGGEHTRAAHMRHLAFTPQDPPQRHLPSSKSSGSMVVGQTTAAVAAPGQQQQPYDNHTQQQHNHGHSSTRFYKLIESRKKAAKMLIVIVIMFGLCYLPVHFLNTLRYEFACPSFFPFHLSRAR